MHILIIPSWYKTSDRPMVGSFFEEQARGLMTKGHQVGVLFPEFLSFSYKNKPFEFEIIDNELPTYYFQYKAKFPRLYNINYRMFARAVSNYFDQYVAKFGKPDIIHAHTVFYGGIAAAYISKKNKIPFVITEHFTPLITGGISKKVDLDMAKTVYQSAQQNIIVSTGFKSLLTKKLNLPVKLFKVVPNMVNPLFFDKSIEKVFNAEEPRFFTMSFLSERKNHKLMLDAFAMIIKDIPKAQFTIGGEGSIKKELEEYAFKIGVSNNVHFLGQLSREDVVAEMHQSDIFLLASTFETFGVVLIEALAMGIPVISTDSVGPRDIINENNGILVPTFECLDFYQAMLHVVKHYNQFSKENIKNECFDKFSENSVLQQIENIYLKALKN
jgi:glycosyltransferase involved in cell wall biosynthesis